MANPTETPFSALTGVERAAILLLTLGEDDAAFIMRNLRPKEVQKVGIAMASMPHVAHETVMKVLAAFIEMTQGQTALGINSENYIRNVITKAVGEEKAKGILDLITVGVSTKGLDTLKWMDPRAVADVVRLEHPQIIAIVLAYLEADQAANVLSLLSERIRADVLLRIATLEGINPVALQELNDIMERQFSGKSAVKSSGIGGLKTTANILNFLDSSIQAQIMESFQSADAELATRVQDLMFVFENLMEADDRSIQSLLREISQDTLLVALKGTEEGMREKFFKNMSRRGAAQLKDDIEAKGPVKLSDVETAQKEILGIARRMADAGEINLGGSGEQYV